MKRWLRLMRHAQGSSQVQPGAGYTIMEVIVVLAVSTLMLTAAIGAFRGRQARVEFNQAVRNYEIKLQNVINDVAKGYYQSGYKCMEIGTGEIIVTPASESPGTQKDCIFLGKIIASNTNGGDILTILGKRTVSGEDVSSYADARPYAVRNSVDITEIFTNSFGLKVMKVIWLGGALTTQVGDFGFVNQLNGGALASSGAARSVLLYGHKDSIVANSTDNTETELLLFEPLSEGILICLKGANDQRAEVRVGENNSQTTISSILDTENVLGAPCYEP